MSTESGSVAPGALDPSELQEEVRPSQKRVTMNPMTVSMPYKERSPSPNDQNVDNDGEGDGEVVTRRRNGSIVEDEDEDDEEEKDDGEEYMQMPPLITAFKVKKAAIPSRLTFWLRLLDVISINIGSIMFIVGSVYFYPRNKDQCEPAAKNCARVGASLFIVGSYLFFQGSLISFYLSGAYELKDMGLVLNSALYIFANFLFIIGSILFLPALVEKGEITGLAFFIIGSLIFLAAPIYNIYRANELRSTKRISLLQFRANVSICIFFMLGSAAFVVGSIYFIPSIYESWSVTVFVWGSVCFQIATLLAPLRFSWKKVQIEMRGGSIVSRESSSLFRLSGDRKSGGADVRRSDSFTSAPPTPNKTNVVSFYQVSSANSLGSMLSKWGSSASLASSSSQSALNTPLCTPQKEAQQTSGSSGGGGGGNAAVSSSSSAQPLNYVQTA